MSTAPCRTRVSLSSSSEVSLGSQTQPRQASTRHPRAASRVSMASGSVRQRRNRGSAFPLLDQRRAKKRKSKSSIRHGARNTSQATAGTRQGHSYSTVRRVSNPTTPASTSRPAFNIYNQNDPTYTDRFRNCICDGFCVPCAQGTCVKVSHAGFYCSGGCDPYISGCGRFLHAHCLGAVPEFESDVLVGARFPGDGGRISISHDFQADPPYYCIVCQEDPSCQADSGLPATPPSKWPYSVLSSGRPSTEAMFELAARVGYDFEYPPDGLHSSQEPKALKRRLLRYIATISPLIDDDIALASLLDNSPRPYPTERKMNPTIAKRMAVCGRRFEIMQLTTTICECACCGRIEPCVSDPWYKSPTQPNFSEHLIMKYQLEHHPDQCDFEPPSHDSNAQHAFRRAALSPKYQDSYLCDCEGPCKGEQWFGCRKASDLSLYRSSHDMMPDDDIDLPVHELCDVCYQDTPKVGKQTNMGLPKRLSTRNRYGPIPIPPRPFVPDGHELPEPPSVQQLLSHYSTAVLDPQGNPRLPTAVQTPPGCPFRADYILHQLLDEASPAEEAAVRQVTAFVKLCRLKQGNLKSTGVTTCVVQDSVLNWELPNLPEATRVITLHKVQDLDTDNPVLGLEVYRYERARIELLLRLLLATNHPAHQFRISESNLSRWKPVGTLYGISVRVNDASLQATSDDNTSSAEPDLVADVGDSGPAPLQNAPAPDHEFTGTEGHQATAEDPLVEANLAMEQFRVIAAQLNASTSGDTLRVPQRDAAPTSGFVDMKKYDWAWTRAFPTIFRPSLVDASNNTWEVFGDRNMPGQNERDRPNYSEWAKYLMWRNDGRPARHPVFCFVINAERQKQHMFSQTSAFLNFSHCPIEGAASLEQVQEKIRDPDRMQEVSRTLQHYTGNVPGTDQYWNSKLREFLAIAFYNSYVRKLPVRCFHTLSMAEYHDPFLRRVMGKYVAAVEGPWLHLNRPGNHRYRTRDEVLDNKVVYNAVMHDYKNVLTMFFAAKCEMWLGHFFRPVHGIQDFSSSKEFAKSRGMIHLHGVGYGSSESFSSLDAALCSAAKRINKLLVDLDACIGERYEELSVGTEPVDDPREEKDISQALKARVDFLERTEAGKAVAQTYAASVSEAEKELENALVRLMEQDFGLSANHAGVAPASWRSTSSGRTDLGFRMGDPDQMVSRQATLDKGELRQPKFEREHCLCERKVNMQNHCFNHFCSDYCWYTDKRLETWLPEHEAGKNGIDEVITCKDGSKRSVLFVRCCRMGFGDKRDEVGPDGDRTGGIEALPHARIEFDKNQQLRFVASRNNPTVLQEPLACFHWGANSDLQFFLVRGLADAEEADNDLGEGETYEDFLKNLLTSRHSGLDNYTSANTSIRYTLGYSCKGAKNSKDWDKMLNNVVESLSVIKADATFQNIVHKFGYQVLKSRDVPRDEATYVLSGGQYVYSTTGVVKMSLSSVSIVALANKSDDDLSNFQTIYKKYKERPVNLEGVNFYLFVSAMNQGKAPLFLGYPSQPTWPLTEEYAKCQLFLFKPHRCNMDALKVNGKFVDALLEYLPHPDYPKPTWAEIIKAKHNVKHVDKEGQQYRGGSEAVPNTQTSERPNEQNEQHAAVLNAVGAEAGLDYEMDDVMADGDLGESDFDSFPVIDPDRDWSCNYDPNASTWLDEHKKRYYGNQANNNNNDNDNEPQVCTLDNETKYRPENAKGYAQKLLIGMFLMLYKRWLAYFDTVSADPSSPPAPPPSLHCYVQGNPGTGKSYVIRTLNNCVISISKRMDRVLNLAPTGCAASLINGKTTNRGVTMPTGKKLTERVDETIPGNSKAVQRFCLSMSRLWILIKDEHSMDPRAAWAWIEARTRVGRHRTVLGDPNNPFEKFSFRPFGGLPFVFSFGDCQQLPPVGNKSHFDPTATKGEANGADGRGKIVFDQFMCPDDPTACMGVQVVMDQTVRQDDPRFLKMVEEMRGGKGMSDESMDMLLDRCLDRLPPAEMEEFMKEALYIMPTWKATVPIIKECLLDLKTDVCRIDADLKPGNRSHIRDDISLPLLNALAEKAKVMLLVNYVVESGMFNGGVGTVIEIVYAEPDGPRNRANKPAYVVVDFPLSTVPANEAWNSDHPTWIPIPLHTQRCEKKCCSATTIPLRVAKAITIDKSQGATVGKDEFWEKLVVQLPASTSKRAGAPGLAQVAVTRVTEIERLAMLSSTDNPLTRETLSKIGVGPAYDRRHAFEARLRANQEPSQNLIRSWIIAEDPATPQTFDGGYKALVQWYRTKFWPHNTQA